MNDAFYIDWLDACNRDEWSWMRDHYSLFHLTLIQPRMDPVMSLGYLYLLCELCDEVAAGV